MESGVELGLLVDGVVLDGDEVLFGLLFMFP